MTAALCGRSVSDKRLQDVLTFIEVHLSDSKLSIATVAKGCGISPRYLSFLLKLHGTPFSTLVWEKRLKMASGWLSSIEAERYLGQRDCVSSGLQESGAFQPHVQAGVRDEPVRVPRESAGRSEAARRVNRSRADWPPADRQCKFPAVTTQSRG